MNKLKYVAAALLVLLGLVLIFRNAPAAPSESLDSPGIDVSPEVREVLDPTRLEIDVDEQGVQSVVELVRARVRDLAKSDERLAGTAATADLADAFCEQLLWLWTPDFDRDFAAAKSRSDPRSRQRAAEFHQAITSHPEMSSNGSVSVTQLRVRACTPDREPAHQRALLEQGHTVMVGERKPGEIFPLPSDSPIEDGFVVAEVTMPMLRKDMLSGSPRAAVVGFRFVYHPEKTCWMPYQSVVLAQQGIAFTMVPF